MHRNSVCIDIVVWRILFHFQHCYAFLSFQIKGVEVDEGLDTFNSYLSEDLPPVSKVLSLICENFTLCSLMCQLVWRVAVHTIPKYFLCIAGFCYRFPKGHRKPIFALKVSYQVCLILRYIQNCRWFDHRVDMQISFFCLQLMGGWLEIFQEMILSVSIVEWLCMNNKAMDFSVPLGVNDH